MGGDGGGLAMTTAANADGGGTARRTAASVTRASMAALGDGAMAPGQLRDGDVRGPFDSAAPATQVNGRDGLKVGAKSQRSAVLGPHTEVGEATVRGSRGRDDEQQQFCSWSLGCLAHAACPTYRDSRARSHCLCGYRAGGWVGGLVRGPPPRLLTEWVIVWTTGVGERERCVWRPVTWGTVLLQGLGGVPHLYKIHS